jgi:hypothetical protein
MKRCLGDLGSCRDLLARRTIPDRMNPNGRHGPKRLVKPSFFNLDAAAAFLDSP